jgi:toxin ParE1/3/4
MAHRVAWSRRALQDVEAIADYIAADSPTYAGIVVKNVVNQTQMPAKFPRARRKVPEFDDENVCELVVYSYRLIYRLQDDEVVNRRRDSRQAHADCSGTTRRQSVV